LPDYISGKENVLLITYFVQLAFIVVLWLASYSLFTLKKRKAAKIEQREKAIRARQFWKVIGPKK
jgi:hypothetical protein